MSQTDNVVRTYEEAKALGLKKYFTGKPCKRGHLDNRWVGCRCCITCKRDLDSKPEAREKRKAWGTSVKGKQVRLSYNLRSKYKLTVEDYEARLQAQDNKCECCKVSFDSVTLPHVDHNHATGKVRDILCVDCNTGIGRAKEDTTILQSWIDYLARHNVS